jgi:hypothetical protein
MRIGAPPLSEGEGKAYPKRWMTGETRDTFSRTDTVSEEVFSLCDRVRPPEPLLLSTRTSPFTPLTP